MRRILALMVLLSGLACIAQAQDTPFSLDQAFDALRSYELGGDSKPLEFLVDRTMSTHGDASAREELANRFAAVAAGEATFDAKLFACRQLYIIGSEKQAPALAPLLRDERLADAARYALENVPGETVDSVFLDALAETSGMVKVGIIHSLRMRRCQAALQPLAACMRAPDLEVAKAAASALGELGTREAARELMLVMLEEVEGLHKTVVDAYLAVAWAELKRGETESARDMFRAVHHAPELKAQMMAAMAGWMAADPSSASRQLLIMLTEEDFQWVQQGLHYVRTVPGEWVTDLCLAILQQEPPAAASYELIIRALVDRADRRALPAVMAALQHEDKAVRMAALEGLRLFGDATAVPLLADIAASAEGDEQRAARTSLAGLAGDGTDEAMLAELANAAPLARLELVRALGERAARPAVPVLLELAATPDTSMQEAALKALAQAAGPDFLPDAVSLLESAAGTPARDAAQRVVVALALKNDASTSRAKPVLTALNAVNDTPARCALLETLGELGDPAALDTLREAAMDNDEDVQAAAVAALADWPDVTPLADLFRIAEASASGRIRSDALGASVDMLRLENDRPVAESIAWYQKALSLTSSASIKRRILAGLSEIADAQALEIVETCRNDNEIRTEAAVASEKIRSNFYTATASINAEQAAQAIDRNIDTRWTTGAVMKGGEWFQLDMTRPAEITGVVLDASHSVHDFPRGYEVYAYLDEEAPGTPLASGQGQGPVLEVSFAPTTARYIRIVQTGVPDGNWWWSIDELRVLVK